MSLKIVTELKTGLRFFAGPSFGDKQMAVRDWSLATDKKKLAETEFSMTDLSEERIASGVAAVRHNMGAINASKTTSDLSFSQDGVLLCGAGYSLNLLRSSCSDDFLAGNLTTIAINRAIHAFEGGEKLDYAFICDSRASLCGNGWLERYEPGRTRLIASTDADPVFVEKPWEERYFFEAGVGGHPAWKAENNVNLPILDVGFCGLFSMLHLCRNVWKAGRGSEKIFLLGHDFSMVNNHKYFDTPYRVSPDQSDPGYDFCAMEDGRGNLVFSQNYLVQQALLITFLCSILVAEGMKISVIGDDGCLIDPVFSRIPA